ncbi:hypothetical protein ACQEU5_03140 [Marinactinospora thermotolerans]|uniref:hypothetical protein n=1 Tax=Marinactinospora thermotolerans TaxID=531310 RepID=UPI0011867EA3|nr:hypothetical protein [Marinactinospora thermotolerans]
MRAVSVTPARGPRPWARASSDPRTLTVVGCVIALALAPAGTGGGAVGVMIAVSCASWAAGFSGSGST